MRFVEVKVKVEFTETTHIQLEEGKTIESMSVQDIKKAILEQDCDGSFSGVVPEYLELLDIGCEFVE